MRNWFANSLWNLLGKIFVCLEYWSNCRSNVYKKTKLFYVREKSRYELAYEEYEDYPETPAQEETSAKPDDRKLQ
jgi:hypothetical protein